MHDRAKIAGGLALLVGIALAPVWQRVAAGDARRLEPRIAAPGSRCVAGRQVMRATHMQVLDSWREDVVREARRTEEGTEGRTVTRSLTGTCLDCHGGRGGFCDRCHADLAVAPVCWECHVDPGDRP